MAGTRGMNTFSETLQKLLSDFVFMKTLPDADIEWVIDAETNIVEKIRDLNAKGFGSAPPAAGGDPALAGAPMAPPMDPMMDPAMAGGPMPGPIPGGMMPSPPPPGGVPGVQTSPTMPGGDELSRILRG